MQHVGWRTLANCYLCPVPQVGSEKPSISPPCCVASPRRAPRTRSLEGRAEGRSRLHAPCAWMRPRRRCRRPRIRAPHPAPRSHPGGNPCSALCGRGAGRGASGCVPAREPGHMRPRPLKSFALRGAAAPPLSRTRALPDNELDGFSLGNGRDRGNLMGVWHDQLMLRNWETGH